MFIKREWKNLDKVMLLVSFFIVCISLAIIGSATHINKGAINYDFVIKQGVAFVIDFMIVIFFSRFDYTKLKKYGKPLYVINLLMLVAVMFIGTSALGAQRWIQLGPITLQPSEFSKLIMIICTAAILSDRVGQLNKWRQVLPIGLYVGIPFLLVLKQPDLGTSLVFLVHYLRHALCRPHQNVSPAQRLFSRRRPGTGRLAFSEGLPEVPYYGILKP